MGRVLERPMVLVGDTTLVSTRYFGGRGDLDDAKKIIKKFESK